MKKFLYVIIFIISTHVGIAQTIQDFGFNSADEISDSLAALKKGDLFRNNITVYFEEYFWLLSLRAMEYTNSGEFDLALADYNEILDYDSTDLNNLLNKAKILFNLRKYDEAINIFDRIYELNPSDVSVLRFKAMALDALCRKDEAAEIRKKFKETK